MGDVGSFGMRETFLVSIARTKIALVTCHAGFYDRLLCRSLEAKLTSLLLEAITQTQLTRYNNTAFF